MQLLSTDTKNAVLHAMEELIARNRETIMAANQQDLAAFDRDDQALYDRLVLDEKKIDGMIEALRKVRQERDPIAVERYSWTHPNGLQITNKTAPFGTILIIYESRPDVTIEAACVAFKSNNKILLKGGKEAKHSNLALVDCWHRALEKHNLGADWIQYLTLSRVETQDFLKTPDQRIDLIVPRGGDALINFVKEYASCPVLVSGRGNNFIYVHDDADWEQAKKIIVHSKIDKISACNALDKVLINSALPNLSEKVNELLVLLQEEKVQIRVEEKSKGLTSLRDIEISKDPAEWAEEYLDRKILIASIDSVEAAIDKINTYSGGHSCAILCEDTAVAEMFMTQVDAAAVYHNASTRFTDGGQMGMGAELAISTDKLHHRGPLGLQQLVTNKWYVFGQGQIRQ